MRSTTLSFFLLPVAVATAQPVMTAADAPALGEQFTFNGDGLYVALPSGGSDQTWDFSASGGSPGNAFTVVAASAGMGAAAFPTADVALATTGFEEFIGITTAGLEHMGQYTGTDNVVYTDPELYLPIPCAYGQTWDDAFAGFWGGGATTFNGNTSAVASGFGTLILPGGTYANVLRIDLTQTRNESSGFTYVRTSNVFYRPGTGYFLASNEVSELYIGATVISTTEELTFLDASSIGMKEVERDAIGIDLMPVPATDHVQINFGAEGQLHLEVLDASGRVVIDTQLGTLAPGIHRHDLAIGALGAGLYTLRLRDPRGQQGERPFVVE